MRHLLIIVILFSNVRWVKPIIEDMFMDERESIRQLPMFSDIHKSLNSMSNKLAFTIMTRLSNLN